MLLMALEPRRLRAPSADGGLLADPPLEEAGRSLEENEVRLRAWEHDFQGRRAGPLRALARREVLARSRAFLDRFGLEPPGDVGQCGHLVVTGHQPEMFHPGVWIKNFAVAGLAGRSEGSALNLIVDNDIPKRAAIRVPTPSGADLRTTLVDFDDWATEVPYEDWSIRDEGRFTSFGARVRETLGGLISDPLIDEYWPLALRAAGQTDRIGLRLAAARRALEGSWGVRNWEIPLSEICETEGFLWFAAHLLAHLPRYQEIHNGALARYRALYHVRSRHHPVPALGRDGEWREAPFWAWRAEAPRRRPLMVRQLARTMELRIAGESDPLMEIPLAPDREACCAVDQLRELARRRVRLRTRALTTTMFARLILGDLFLHGIGGAKYDELGDEIIRRFFAIEPPTYLTLSMTLWPGLEPDPATPGRLREVDRRLRDLEFNPERNLPDPGAPGVREWVEAKRHALAGPVATRRQRVARFEQIRKCNEALQGAVAVLRGRLEEERTALRTGLRRNHLVQSRELAFPLHSRTRLRRAFGRVVPEVFGE
jgi:hypothetical protein